MGAQFFSIEKFGKDKQYKKAFFLISDTMDKVGVMVSDDEALELVQQKGKQGVLTLGFQPKGYDYSLSFQGFKVRA